MQKKYITKPNTYDTPKNNTYYTNSTTTLNSLSNHNHFQIVPQTNYRTKILLASRFHQKNANNANNAVPLQVLHISLKKLMKQTNENLNNLTRLTFVLKTRFLTHDQPPTWISLSLHRSYFSILQRQHSVVSISDHSSFPYQYSLPILQNVHSTHLACTLAILFKKL